MIVSVGPVSGAGAESASSRPHDTRHTRRLTIPSVGGGTTAYRESTSTSTVSLPCRHVPAPPSFLIAGCDSPRCATRRAGQPGHPLSQRPRLRRGAFARRAGRSDSVRPHRQDGAEPNATCRRRHDSGTGQDAAPWVDRRTHAHLGRREQDRAPRPRAGSGRLRCRLGSSLRSAARTHRYSSSTP